MDECFHAIAGFLLFILGFCWVVILPAIGLLWCLGWIQ